MVNASQYAKVMQYIEVRIERYCIVLYLLAFKVTCWHSNVQHSSCRQSQLVTPSKWHCVVTNCRLPRRRAAIF